MIGVLELKSQIPLVTVKLFKRFGEPPKGLDGKGRWRCAYSSIPGNTPEGFVLLPADAGPVDPRIYVRPNRRGAGSAWECGFG